MRWVDHGIDFTKTKITREGTRKFIDATVSRLGSQKVKAAFERELEKAKPNPFHFVIKTLPEMMKGYERVGEMKKISELLKPQPQREKT